MSTVTEPRPVRAPKRLLRGLLTYRRILFALLVPLGLLLTSLAAAFPWTVERLYARGLYRGMWAVFGRLFSLLPFSVAELLLFGGILLVLALLARGLVRLARRDPRRPQRPVLWLASTLLCAAGVIYGLFVLTCGLNYHRPTFAEQSGLRLRDSSAAELAALYTELGEQAGALRANLPEDAQGVMRLEPRSLRALAKAAPAAYEKLAEQYPVFGGYTPLAKRVLASRLMSWCNISGIFVPFTFEANVNIDVVDYNIPFNLMHELAHSKGFMREDEANFIGYLACRESEDAQIAYSGTMLALIQSGNALYAADAELYRALYAGLDEGVRRDLAANSAYWRQFEGPVAEVASAMNDTYLKSNRQADGVKSYGRMVDLLLADYRERHGLD